MKFFILLFGLVVGGKLKFEPNVKGILSEECQKDAYPAERVLYQPKVHQINLDLAPKQRWVELGKMYEGQLKSTLATIIGVINKLNDKVIPYLEEVS